MRTDRPADIPGMDAAKRIEILGRYAEHVQRFEEVASRLHVVDDNPAGGVHPRPIPNRQPTVRELEVLRLIAAGLTNSEIAKRLHLSEETVKTHTRNLLAALQARSRAHAVAVGFRRAIID
jgi:DNA-binding NarL/FixJ family response regulator